MKSRLPEILNFSQDNIKTLYSFLKIQLNSVDNIIYQEAYEGISDEDKRLFLQSARNDYFQQLLNKLWSGTFGFLHSSTNQIVYNHTIEKDFHKVSREIYEINLKREWESRDENYKIKQDLKKAKNSLKKIELKLKNLICINFTKDLLEKYKDIDKLIAHIKKNEDKIARLETDVKIQGKYTSTKEIKNEYSDFEEYSEEIEENDLDDSIEDVQEQLLMSIDYISNNYQLIKQFYDSYTAVNLESMNKSNRHFVIAFEKDLLNKEYNEIVEKYYYDNSDLNKKMARARQSAKSGRIFILAKLYEHELKFPKARNYIFPRILNNKSICDEIIVKQYAKEINQKKEQKIKKNTKIENIAIKMNAALHFIIEINDSYLGVFSKDVFQKIKTNFLNKNKLRLSDEKILSYVFEGGGWLLTMLRSDLKENNTHTLLSDEEKIHQIDKLKNIYCNER